jgi:hypothetical protein
MSIIDAHTHTKFGGGVNRETGAPETQEQYFKEWREAGIGPTNAVTPGPSGSSTSV